MINIEYLKLVIRKNKYIYEKIIRIYRILVNIKIKFKYFYGTNKDIFTDIYLNNKWRDKDSVSGSGSNLIQTQTIREELPEIIKKYKIKSILDIPCGDFYWMKEIDLKDVNYIGADLVTEIINKNIKKFKKSNIDFKIIDLLSDTLPYSDLIFCRDCLVHFSFKDIFKALINIKKTNAKYLMTTNFDERNSNINIATGSWTPINLCNPPFNFPEPILIIMEKCTEGDNRFSDKALYLWETNQIPFYD